MAPPAPCRADAAASSAPLQLSPDGTAAAASGTEEAVSTPGAGAETEADEGAAWGSWHIQRSRCLYRDHSESTTRESLHSSTSEYNCRCMQGLGEGNMEPTGTKFDLNMTQSIIFCASLKLGSVPSSSIPFFAIELLSEQNKCLRTLTQTLHPILST